MSQALANLLFPDISIDPHAQKKHRTDGQVVTRFAPSPTGFIHVGALYVSLICERIAQDNNGVFFLRIEDTDQSRIVDNGINQIIDGLKQFGITFNEGPQDGGLSGDFGPYIQSQREHLYLAFVKDALERGIAYPCWLTADELDATRKEQELLKQPTGVYGNYARRRNASLEEVTKQLEKDPNGRVVRFKSPGNLNNKKHFTDAIRGDTSGVENYNDIVILKRPTESGLRLPTYHFAHLVDDYLMGTTHVIRGEERLPSVPLHIQLFETFGLIPPTYAHTAQILKREDGKKRKLSKRKDPEANVQYLLDAGFPVGGILEYLMTIIDSGFEERIQANPSKSYSDYPIVLENLNKSGALMDMEKLRRVSNHNLSRQNNQAIYNQALPRIKKQHPQLAELMEADPTFAQTAIGIERAYDTDGNYLPNQADNDPKRYTVRQDIVDNITFCYDELLPTLTPDKERPETVTQKSRDGFITDYLSALDLSMSTEDRFEQTKNIAHKHGYASNNAEFKTGEYIGKVGNLMMVMRLKLCHSSRTPDLYSIMQLLGKEKIAQRLH